MFNFVWLERLNAEVASAAIAAILCRIGSAPLDHVAGGLNLSDLDADLADDVVRVAEHQIEQEVTEETSRLYSNVRRTLERAGSERKRAAEIAAREATIVAGQLSTRGWLAALDALGAFNRRGRRGD